LSLPVNVDWGSMIEEVFTIMQKHGEISKFDIPDNVKASWVADLNHWHVNIENEMELVPVIKAFLRGYWWGQHTITGEGAQSVNK